ncbi:MULTISPECIES: type II secretion system F family protein [Tatumella]|uniref:Type II secretion system F family protein n=4 Tax=Tatumella TaxID=82986 RepID=A0ABW1VRB3_9GAMM|nr:MULTISPECIES: type II secretion system F family protein [unclassified Tatumella]MBS0877001.1 type II secretion system F family protein [Tatumella sp. JGM82]MBS0890862.1 type II secretion system F family protein [Tatumella sp. JGM94]MBS0901893.1 type II secretion system F family protein [Tatumella sp. JGM100]
MNPMLVMMIVIVLVITGNLLLRKIRNRKLQQALTVADASVHKLKIQQLKEHHHTEIVLEQNNPLLNIYRKLDANMAYKGLLAMGMFMLVVAGAFFSGQPLSRQSLLMAAMISLVSTIILPGMLRSVFVKRRVKTLSAELPWMIELLAIGVQCGMTIEQAFKFLSDKMSGINPDFVPFISRLVRRTEVSGLSVALEHFYRELPSAETRMFCAMLQQSIQYGSSMYEQLVELAREIREVQLLATEEKIGQLGAKMSVPLILFFMFPVIIIVAAPGVMRLMGNMGN